MSRALGGLRRVQLWGEDEGRFWVRSSLTSLYLGSKRRGIFSSRILSFNSGGQPRNGKSLCYFGGLWGFSDQHFLWKCGLNENGPDWFIYVNVWSPVDKTAWEGLGSVALWEKRCHWGWALKRFRKPMPFPVSFCLWIGYKLSATVYLLAYCHTPPWRSWILPSRTAVKSFIL